MDNPKYYEEFDWEEMPGKHIIEKASVFLGIIPADVKTILDLGCGNGMITNRLAEKYDVTGVDRSAAALKKLKTKAIQCNCNSLPFGDHAFDLVLSSELLEHLEEQIFNETIEEIKRVAKKYILLSVPNNEHIQRDLIQCPSCRFVYNMNYHQRSMSIGMLQTAFSGYEVVYSDISGPKVKPSFRWLTRMKHRFAPTYSWIPTYWTKKRRRNSVCPMCNHSFLIPFRHHPVSFFYDVITWLFSKSKHYWLIVLLKKTDLGK